MRPFLLFRTAAKMLSMLGRLYDVTKGRETKLGYSRSALHALSHVPESQPGAVGLELLIMVGVST